MIDPEDVLKVFMGAGQAPISESLCLNWNMRRKLRSKNRPPTV